MSCTSKQICDPTAIFLREGAGEWLAFAPTYPCFGCYGGFGGTALTLHAVHGLMLPSEYLRDAFTLIEPGALICDYLVNQCARHAQTHLIDEYRRFYSKYEAEAANDRPQFFHSLHAYALRRFIPKHEDRQR